MRIFTTVTTLSILFIASLRCTGTNSLTLAENIGSARVLRAQASPTAYEAFLRAEISHTHNDLSTAIRQLSLAELSDPTDPELTARRVAFLLEARQFNEAHELAEHLVRAFPSFATAWVALASVQEHSGDRPAALRSVTHALGRDPNDPDLRALAARLAGGDNTEISRALTSTVDTRTADRVLAARLSLATGAQALTEGQSRRRRALEALARGQYSTAERLLTRLVNARPQDVIDREALVEARARQGRPNAAVAIVAGLSLRADRVSHSHRARLWWLCARAERALDETASALAERPDDSLALRVGAQALFSLHRDGEAFALLARVPIDNDSSDAGETIIGSWSGLPINTPSPPGLHGDGRGTGFASARAMAISQLLSRGQPALARRLFRSSLTALSGDNLSGARDLLRAAWSHALDQTGDRLEALAALTSVETPWGQHRRGALLASTESPSTVLSDLRVRTEDPIEDALADAWIALVCHTPTPACDPRDTATALAHANRVVPTAPVTLRARAMTETNPAQALALLSDAAQTDPWSPWNEPLRRSLASRRVRQPQ